MSASTDGNRLIAWMLGICAVLLAAGVLGGIATYGKVASIDAKVGAIEKRMDRLEDKVDRYLEDHR